jgi:hypothetical protein
MTVRLVRVDVHLPFERSGVQADPSAQSLDERLRPVSLMPLTGKPCFDEEERAAGSPIREIAKPHSTGFTWPITI